MVHKLYFSSLSFQDKFFPLPMKCHIYSSFTVFVPFPSFGIHSNLLRTFHFPSIFLLSFLFCNIFPLFSQMELVMSTRGSGSFRCIVYIYSYRVYNFRLYRTIICIKVRVTFCSEMTLMFFSVHPIIRSNLELCRLVTYHFKGTL